VERKNPSDSIR